MSVESMELILYQLQELNSGQKDIQAAQDVIRKSVVDLSLKVEHRLTKVEVRASVLAMVTGAVTSIMAGLWRH